MSFKDDFLEALRSVKRDFFRESEYTDVNETAAAETKNNSRETVAVEEPTASYSQPASTSASAMSDSEVFAMYEQASVIDDSDDSDIFEGDDNQRTGPQSAPFRSFNPAAFSQEPREEEFSHSTIQGAPVEPRRAYDFAAQEIYEDDKTIISRNTIIRGSLQTDDSIRMLGQILGDIECKSNVVVAGKIRGNTAAANAYVIDAQIDGNMLCDDSVNISNDAWILGNIRAQQAEIDGKVKGNIEIRHNISVGATSSIIGNISADELEIKRGAFINGQIIMYSPSRDVLDRFDNFKG